MSGNKLYLSSFNVVSALLWLSVLIEGVHHAVREEPPLAFWNAMNHRLFLAQHLALLEIAHSALGLVGSPLIATTIQVLSRVWMLDMFTFRADTCHQDFSLYLMVLSWSLVEVPRYSFYAAQLMMGDASVPYPLFFLRYSLFMVLYPTGISGEILQQVSAYPYFERTDQEWNKRLSHIAIGCLYVPLGPFMIWNMWMMRKRAMKKRFELSKPKPVPQGLVWPVTNTQTGDRSTTDTAKKIFAAAARGNANQGEDVAKRVEKERNWRFGYTKHIAAHVTLSCQDAEQCVKIAEAGLKAAHSLFRFSSGGMETSFEEAMRSPSPTKFATGTLSGRDSDNENVVHMLQVPYKGKVLEGKELVDQCDDWASKGTIEQTASEAIKMCATQASQWMDLKDVLFIMLGATSAMGPLDNLLAHGATVVAIDLKRPKIWEGLFKRVMASRGSIIFPLDQEGLASQKDEIEHAGCDMLQDTAAICDWLDTVIEQNPGKQVICGNYTYLDGALHVQLALAGDAIMERICAKQRNACLAFLCTPTDDHVIPKEARVQAQSNFSNSKWWQKILTGMGVLVSNDTIANVNDMCIVDAIVSRQGPNYALAKRMQHWRAIVARSRGHTVSSNVAPSTATQSVLSNPQFAAGYYGWRYFAPLEVFAQETSGSVMFALFVHDLRNQYSKANSNTFLAHPLELFSLQSFHGGIWRCGFSIDSVGVPAAVSFYVQKYAGFGIAGIAGVIGAINYIIKGSVV